MTKLRTTIWFYQSLVAEEVIKGFELASSAIKLDANFKFQGNTIPISLSVWNEIYKSFKDYEFTGEAQWIMHGGLGQLKGKIFWPIQNPGNLPGTVEFDFFWDNKKKSRRKDNNYIFDNIDLLGIFLQKLAYAVSAESLLVEPLRLPPDIADFRYERFKKLSSTKTLSNIDWIFGIKSTNRQKNDFSNISDIIYKKLENGDFILYILTPNPLKLAAEEDVKFLTEIEKKIGLL